MIGDTSLGPTTTQPAATAQATRTTAISSDFETFLRMLSVQMQNQDPLNPIDSSDYAVQLATFSGVEQQVQTNQILSALGGQLATSGMAELAAWVGKDARAAMPVQFDGSPVTLSPNPAALADAVELVVRDEQGTEVHRMQLPVSAEPIEWAGVDSDGAPYPPGVYAFEVVSYSAGEPILTEPANVYATVREVRSEGGITYLTFDGDVAVPAGSVSAVRAAR